MARGNELHLRSRVSLVSVSTGNISSTHRHGLEDDLGGAGGACSRGAAAATDGGAWIYPGILDCGDNFIGHSSDGIAGACLLARFFRSERWFMHETREER